MSSLLMAVSSGLVGGLLLAFLPGENKRVHNFIVLISSLIAMFFSWRLAMILLAGRSIGIDVELGRLALTLKPDPLGAVFGLIVSTHWLFIAIYSFVYMAEKDRLRTFYIFFLFALSITLGVAFAGNLLTLYIFFVLLAFAIYPLLIHERSPENIKAGKTFILYGFLKAGILLVALIITYYWAENLDFSARPILEDILKPGINWLLFLYLTGFGIRAAVIPFHRWLPATMTAYTPVSALLHAIAVVYSGIYGILRTVYSVFGHEKVGELFFTNVFLYVIAFTILAGAIIALRQDDLKRCLSYQTISHLAYILLGTFIIHPSGLRGAIIQMFSYSLLKIIMLLLAGIISELTGKKKMSRMKGIGYRLPVTMTLFAISTLGMIGILPLNTFWAKYYLMVGSVGAGKWPFSLVLIICGILNGACFIPFIIKAFSGEKERTVLEGKGRNYILLLPPLFLTIVAVIMGLWPGMIWPFVQAVVDSFF